VIVQQREHLVHCRHVSAGCLQAECVVAILALICGLKAEIAFLAEVVEATVFPAGGLAAVKGAAVEEAAEGGLAGVAAGGGGDDPGFGEVVGGEEVDILRWAADADREG
jgi:hypothetical protein